MNFGGYEEPAIEAQHASSSASCAEGMVVYAYKRTFYRTCRHITQVVSLSLSLYNVWQLLLGGRRFQTSVHSQFHNGFIPSRFHTRFHTPGLGHPLPYPVSYPVSYPMLCTWFHTPVLYEWYKFSQLVWALHFCATVS